MDRLKAYQLERVGKLLQFAYQHSAFYRDRIDQCGLPVDRITDLDQLRQLPRLSKHHELRTKN